jgi:hypothetical protein
MQNLIASPQVLVFFSTGSTGCVTRSTASMLESATNDPKHTSGRDSEGFRNIVNQKNSYESEQQSQDLI